MSRSITRHGVGGVVRSRNATAAREAVPGPSSRTRLLVIPMGSPAGRAARCSSRGQSAERAGWMPSRARPSGRDVLLTVRVHSPGGAAVHAFSPAATVAGTGLPRIGPIQSGVAVGELPGDDQVDPVADDRDAEREADDRAGERRGSRPTVLLEPSSAGTARSRRPRTADDQTAATSVATKTWPSSAQLMFMAILPAQAAAGAGTAAGAMESSSFTLFAVTGLRRDAK